MYRSTFLQPPQNATDILVELVAKWRDNNKMALHDPLKKAPATPPTEGLSRNSSKSLVDLVSVGTTSRQWKLPFDARSHSPSPSLSFIGPNEYLTARNACEFLRDNTPLIYAEWRTSYFSAFPEREAAASSARSLNLPVASRALFEIEPTDPLAIRNPMSLSKRHPLVPPRAIELPSIDEHHWYYRRHFNIGNYVVDARDPKAASTIEAQQDVASLRHYLSRYDVLAKDTSGRHLFDATTWAAFRDTYFSCMEMCIKDLKLPSHFLALVHYGIGAHLAIGQQFSTWQYSPTSPQQTSLLQATHRVFSEIAEMYKQDFPH